MTLVIAERKDGNISLTADSRLSMNNDYVDYCSKIFSIPTKILPICEEGKVSNIPIYNHNLGLAVIGNFNSTYLIKEILYEIIQNIQFVPIYSDNCTMKGIMKFIEEIFRTVSERVAKIVQNKKGLCTMLLCGYCPTKLKLQIFEFNINEGMNSLETTCNEILEEDGIEFFGSGGTKAKNIYNENNNFSLLHIVRKVIKSGEIASVGGGLQYGKFKDSDFRIFGVVENVKDDEGSFDKFSFKFRGINLYENEFENEEYHITTRFITPFEDELK